MKTNPVKILSVGGSIIIPPSGFDSNFLIKFRELILAEVKKGARFILVIGGGATARNYQQAVKNFGISSATELDWVGIKTTALNAELVRVLFGEYAHKEVAVNPTKKIKTTKPIIVACGWKPGCSTDKDAVLLAKTYGAKEVINLSNIDYVYDSDPRTNPGAKKLERVTWKELRKIVGNTWTPGANVPFDPMAAKEAEKLKLTVQFVKGTEIEALKNVLGNKVYGGSIISTDFI